MDQIISYIGYGILGYGIWLVIKLVIKAVFIFYRIKQEVNNVEENFKEFLVKVIHIVKQEKEGDMYYWYDNDNGVFLAQGKTWEDIVDTLKTRFPSHIFVLNEHEMIMGPDFEIVKFDTKD